MLTINGFENRPTISTDYHSSHFYSVFFCEKLRRDSTQGASLSLAVRSFNTNAINFCSSWKLMLYNFHKECFFVFT